MLSPAYLADCADDVVAAFDELQTRIVCDIARRIVKTGEITDTARWQIAKLQEAGMLYEDVMRSVSQLTDRTTREIDNLFADAGIRSIELDNALARAAGYATNRLMQSPAVLRTLSAGLEKTKGVMYNLTLTTANNAHDLYIRYADDAYMQVMSGAFDYTTAIRSAIKVAASQGAVITYPSGHKDKLDVAVRRTVLTGVSQTGAKVQEANLDALGVDLVETTAHAGARPEHAVWQGKVFSRSGYDPRYPKFEEATGYGAVDGLCGANCRHGFFPFFDGVSRAAYTEEDLQALESEVVTYNGSEIKKYDATQMQRQMERDIRKQKRECVALQAGEEAATKPEMKEALHRSYQDAAAKLKRQETDLKDFCKQTGLPTQAERQQVIGFGRSEGQKAVWAKKGLDREQEEYLGIQQTLIKTNLPKPDTTLSDPLQYELPTGKRGIIPGGASVQRVRTMAGYGTATNIRAASSLSERYGGQDWKWEKKGGIIESAYNRYDVHWYEYDGKQYDAKIKGMKERK